MIAVVRLLIEQAEESQDTLGETFFRIEGEDDEQVLMDITLLLSLDNLLRLRMNCTFLRNALPVIFSTQSLQSISAVPARSSPAAR